MSLYLFQWPDGGFELQLQQFGNYPVSQAVLIGIAYLLAGSSPHPPPPHTCATSNRTRRLNRELSQPNYITGISPTCENVTKTSLQWKSGSRCLVFPPPGSAGHSTERDYNPSGGAKRTIRLIHSSNTFLAPCYNLTWSVLQETSSGANGRSSHDGSLNVRTCVWAKQTEPPRLLIGPSIDRT